MNRKYVLKNKKRFYIFILLMSVMISCTLIAGTVNGADTNPEYTLVTVEKGDTLWDLAKDYCKGGDIRRFIDSIEKINNLTDSTIFEGEVIKMPA